MIYLIGGPPRCGKTTVAKNLSRRLKIGWISADILESVIRTYIPAKKHKALFPKNVLRKITGGGNEAMYQKFSGGQIAKAYLQQGKTSWNALRVFVEYALLEEHDFVIEGHQLHPKLVAELIQQYPQKIRAVFLVKKDIEAMVAGFKKNKAAGDWVIQKTKNPGTLIKIAQMLSYFAGYIQKEAYRYGLPIYFMDKEFTKQLGKVEQVLAKK